MRKIRVAVVGLGHFAKVAVLPAFRYTRRADLAALISGDPGKLDELGRRYRPILRVGYDDFDRLLERGDIDAVYLSLPNDMHADFAVRAAHHGTHVICEKPMAPTLDECDAMIHACAEAGAKLMIAYRLHFQSANLAAIAAIRDGQIGEPRIFHSVLTQRRPGAGPPFDLGVYCINTARSLFDDDPEIVSGINTDESIAATMRFPDDRVASFDVSFGAADASYYEVIGTHGKLRLDGAYEYATGMDLSITRRGKEKRKHYGKRDQIAAELEHFARCVLDGRDPEPGGAEGKGDVRMMLALYESARTSAVVHLENVPRDRPPQPSQQIDVPPHGKPRTVHVQSAGK